ncbi:MAG: hypothetical protein SFT90_02030 [Rickettsiales bacterium]|nr:hypothetical protein [Rickettsiales bacterium]
MKNKTQILILLFVVLMLTSSCGMKRALTLPPREQDLAKSEK